MSKDIQQKKQKTVSADVIAREYTIHLGKLVHGRYVLQNAFFQYCPHVLYEFFCEF